MSLSVSVVIPSLNEAALLPGLLAALKRQTYPVHEVILADAGSTDGTLEVARSLGARIVKGGRPAVGRNAGAAAANGDLILFLDADVLPADDFLEKFLRVFERKRLDIATTLISPLSDRPIDLFICEAANLYMQLVQRISPHAPGFCILVRRSLHEQIGGFNEAVLLAEDHEYVQRGAQLGRFRVVRSVSIPTSVRRIEKEGLVQLALKYLYCELHALARKPIYTIPFSYEFGNFDQRPSRSITDIRRLRARLRMTIRLNPLNRMTHLGLRTLDVLARRRWSSVRYLRQNLKSLQPVDISVLRAYLAKRQQSLRTKTRAVRERALKKMPRVERILLLGGHLFQFDPKIRKPRKPRQ